MSKTFEKVLITGGLGFIGSHLVKRLAEHAIRITIMDVAPYEHSTASDLGIAEWDNVEILARDCLGENAFADLQTDYDLIIHASAVLGIQKVADEPLHTLDTNILGTRSVLEFAARQRNLKKFVFFSTSEVYGQEANRKDEASPFVIANDSPRWCYAASKVAGEFYVQAYGNQYGFETAMVRPFNVYGPYRYGSNAMTKLVAKALKGEDISISGDGRQSRSWCYIDDFVDGVMAACMQSQEKHAVFNIGNDREFLTMLDFAEKLIRISGSSSRVRIEGKPGIDVQVRRPDIEKARRTLGYNPTVDLETGMARVIHWAAQATRSLN